MVFSVLEGTKQEGMHRSQRGACETLGNQWDWMKNYEDVHITAKIIRYINMMLFIQRLWSVFLVLLVVLQVGSFLLSPFCRRIHSGKGYWKTAVENVYYKETNFMSDYSKIRNRINVWLPALIPGLQEITSVLPGNTYPPKLCRNKMQTYKRVFLSKATC